MNGTLILLTLATIFTSAHAGFGSGFTAGYITQDIANKIRSKVQKRTTKNITNNEISLTNCYKFKNLPSQFIKDIIIPTENYLYRKKCKNPKTCVSFTPKSNLTDFQIKCNYKILENQGELAIEFLWNITIFLSIAHVILVCLCGKEEDHEELKGFICGAICNEIIRSLCEDDD